MKSTYLATTNPHRVSTNPHRVSTNPHTPITWIINAYEAPNTIGEENIPNYEEALRIANIALHELIFKIRRDGKVPIE